MNKQKGPVPKSRENGVITNSRVNAKLEENTRWYAHLPIIYKKPIFHRAVRSQRKNRHNSIRNAFIHTYPFFEMHTFTLISFRFVKYK